MIQFYLKQADQYERHEAGGEVRFDMFILPYIDRTGFKAGLGHFEGILDPGKAAVDLPHFHVAHIKLACDDGIVPVILFLFTDLLLVERKIPAVYDFPGALVEGYVLDIGSAPLCGHTSLDY